MIRTIEGRSFEELEKCRLCGAKAEQIEYNYLPQNYGIRATCKTCGRNLGFVPQL